MDLNTNVEFDTPPPVDVIAVAATMGKVPTAEQVDLTEGSLTGEPVVVRAYAGAAKTTSLRFIAGVRPATPMVYICFNKPVALESAKVFPPNVQCTTAHSLAYRAMLATYGYNKTKKMTDSLRTRDVQELLKVKDFPIMGGTAKLDSSTIAYAILRTVVRFTQSADLQVAKPHFDKLPKFETLDSADFYAVRAAVVADAERLWAYMVDPKSPVKLGHDGYLKAWHLSGPVIDYPVILLDEGQDTNPVLFAIIEAQTHAQIIMVGDQHQSIYEWRGAINAMGSLVGAREYRLTKSFRFGENIAAAANGVLRVLGETVPLVGNERQADKIVATADGTIICRTNGEILSRLIDIVADGRKAAFVQGGVSDMLAVLDGADYIRNKRPSYHALFMGFKDWDEFVDYAEKSGDGEANKVVALVNKYGIYALKNALRQVREVEADAQVVLTTGHKSKGREWPAVTLADDFKKQPEKKEDGTTAHNIAETRLFYVAMTRAMKELALPFWAHFAYGIDLPEGKEPPVEKEGF